MIACRTHVYFFIPAVLMQKSLLLNHSSEKLPILHEQAIVVLNIFSLQDDSSFRNSGNLEVHELSDDGGQMLRHIWAVRYLAVVSLAIEMLLMRMPLTISPPMEQLIGVRV